MGVAPVIIHLWMGFSGINQPAIGVPPVTSWKAPCGKGRFHEVSRVRLCIGQPTTIPCHKPSQEAWGHVASPTVYPRINYIKHHIGHGLLLALPYIAQKIPEWLNVSVISRACRVYSLTTCVKPPCYLYKIKRKRRWHTEPPNKSETSFITDTSGKLI